jgi:hypothetical protein
LLIVGALRIVLHQLMRPTLHLSLTAVLLLAGCADHTGELLARNSPQAPINQPDSGAGSGGAGGSNPTHSTGTEGTAGGQEPGSGLPPNSGSGSTSAGGSSGSGSTPPEGTSGGSPVPEPSTLLLVGTGLAGAAILRRRRRIEPASD